MLQNKKTITASASKITNVTAGSASFEPVNMHVLQLNVSFLEERFSANLLTEPCGRDSKERRTVKPRALRAESCKTIRSVPAQLADVSWIPSSCYGAMPRKSRQRVARVGYERVALHYLGDQRAEERL